jgi:F-type H+-transporting ATPase subunit delta
MGKREIFKYAQSLGQFAYENNLLEKIKEDFQKAKQFLWDKKDIRAFFLSLKINKEEKKKIIYDFKDWFKIEEVFCNFLLLILEENKWTLFLEIYEKFLKIYKDYQRKISLKIKSAYPLEEEELERIKGILKKVFKRELIIEKEVDTSLLAGLQIFTQEGEKIDLSVKGKLEKLKKVVVNE